MARVVDERINRLNGTDYSQLKKFEFRIPSNRILSDINENLNLKNILTNFVSITLNCKAKIQNDFNIKKLCQVSVSIQLKNLSNTNSFDMIVLARNSLK